MSVYSDPCFLLFTSGVIFCSVLLFRIISVFKMQESIFMLLMTVVCLCFQCAHAIFGRSSFQPFRGTSHKSTVNSCSSFFKCFSRRLIRSTTATSHSFPILHKASLFIYFIHSGSLKTSCPSGFNPSEMLITPIYFDASLLSARKPTKIDTYLFFCFSSPGRP